MGNIKTAISLRKSLFEQADRLASKMKVSRSRVFSLALEEYLQRQHNRELLAQINAAVGDELDPAEETLRHKFRRTHRRIVEREG